MPITNVNTTSSMLVHPSSDAVNFEKVLPSLERSISNCLEDKVPLRSALSQFLQVFPKLSLWERFKDFFGLSDKADNQRDVAMLHAVNIFNSNTSLNNDSRVEKIFAQALYDTGIATPHDYLNKSQDLKVMTAEVMTNLLQRNPQMAANVNLSDVNMVLDNGTGHVELNGQIAFNEGWGLPFRIGTNLRNKLDYINSTKERPVFLKIYEMLPAEVQINLQMRLWSEGFPQVKLFSAEGFLGELVPPAPKYGATQVAKEWNSLSLMQYNILTNTKEMDKANIVMADYAFTPQINEGSEYRELLADSDRGGLNKMVMHVNGTCISPQTLSAMQAKAVEVSQRSVKVDPKLNLNEICVEWASLLQKDMACDREIADRAAGTVMYTLFQGGAGRGNMLLSRMGPQSNLANFSRKEVGVMHIDTQKHETLVAYAEYSIGSYNSANNKINDDCRAGGVQFSLPSVSSTAEPAEIAARFARTTVTDVKGFGMRFPDISLLPEEILDVLTSDKTSIN